MQLAKFLFEPCLGSHYTAEFRMRVERTMRDLAQRNQWLGEHGGEVVGL